jgi:hypothetical protein
LMILSKGTMGNNQGFVLEVTLRDRGDFHFPHAKEIFSSDVPNDMVKQPIFKGNIHQGGLYGTCGNVSAR